MAAMVAHVEPAAFTTEDGVRLQAELRRPERPPRAAAVICHPHPKHGGSKDHPILWALRNELAGRRDVTTLAFNFRGVMGSGGTYGGGHDELRDLRAAIGFARAQVPGVPTVVAGWSFGANVAVREALEDDRVGALSLIGIPLRPGDLTLPRLPSASELSALRVPVLLLAGDADVYCPAEELRSMAGACPMGRAVILEGTDHFLWRREKEAAATVGEFVDGVLG
jgi:alpha/beta superfamily hydrolase